MLSLTFFEKKKNTVNEWNQVFLVSSALYVASAASFILFGSGEVQDWNDDTYKIEKNSQKQPQQSNEIHF